ncbi:MAG: flagellar biosynthetic protein FliO [Gimesia sp.]
MIRFLYLSVLMLICSLSYISSAVSEDVNPGVRTSGFRQPQRNETQSLQTQRLQTNGGNSRSVPDQYSSQQASQSRVKNNGALPATKTKTPTNRITPTDRAIQSGQNQTSKKTSPRQAPSIWGTLGALLVVISLILVAAKLFKKHHPMASANLPLEVMEVLGKRPLDARQTIHFVRCGSRVLILGSSPAGLEMLSEVLDPVEVDLITGMCRERAQSSKLNSSFRNLFQATQKKAASRERNQSVDTFHPIENTESDQTPRTQAMEDFADYDSVVTRLQNKLQQNSRQPLSDNAESGHV